VSFPWFPSPYPGDEDDDEDLDENEINPASLA
jgi:hypothetical protein